jgi:hypothetical protein
VGNVPEKRGATGDAGVLDRPKISVVLSGLSMQRVWEYNGEGTSRFSSCSVLSIECSSMAATQQLLPQRDTEHMSKYYADADIPDELRRSFDVYDRIRALQIPLGTFDTAWYICRGLLAAHFP